MRVINWEIKLVQYIDGLRGIPFDWGTNDCLTFANGAHRAITGKGFADDVAGVSTTNMRAKRQFISNLRATGAASAPELMDNRLERHTGLPRRGYIVAREIENYAAGYGLGVCIGRRTAFVGTDGLVFGEKLDTDLSWIVQ